MNSIVNAATEATIIFLLEKLILIWARNDVVRRDWAHY